MVKNRFLNATIVSEIRRNQNEIRVSQQKNTFMKKIHFIGLMLLTAICFSCDEADDKTQEQEAENLDQLFSEIESLASSESCEDATKWAFTSFGSKACGGPVGFIAYATTIDTVLFLERIESHRAAQQAFNQKWAIASDCSAPLEPTSVLCENGNPVFEYSN